MHVYISGCFEVHKSSVVESENEWPGVC